MPATFNLGQKVQNTRSDSQYYGQIGEVTDIQSMGSGARYVVRWPEGESHVYRGDSLTEALVPESNFKQSDTGFRNNRRVIKHKIPVSNRPALV